ncbi:MAG TPA: TMEM165/GDT1 family protein [Candidatus Acidoferrales bacterium]|nr:TMEM165/GDT1 family protein [Candidatus Acidoferrales bacterium]
MKTLWVVFVSVLIAELGDKTQLATLLFATDPNKSAVGVFVAASLALVCSSLIAVLVGTQIARFISPSMLNTVAGIGFIVIGVWMLFGRS